MNGLLKYLIESSIILCVFYLIYLLIYQGDKGSRFNRWYLILSSFLAIILPFVKLPIIPVEQLDKGVTLHDAIQLPEIIIRDDITVLSAQPQFTLADFITLIYLAGFIFFLSRFLIELWTILKRIRSNSKDSQVFDRYIIIPTKGKLPTCSFYKYLFWDDSQIFDKRESDLIIKHEQGHIYQKHTFDIIYLEILRIIFWFNPIVHGYKKALLLVHEFLADEFAMTNTNGQGFIALLGKQVLGNYNLTLSNHFSKSQTVKRIKMIKSGKKKPAVLRWTVMVTVALTMFYFFSCEQDNHLNDLVPQDESLPVLETGWSYVSAESLSPTMTKKLNDLKSDYPSVEFYVAKALSDNVPFPDLYSNPEFREKYAFKIWFEKDKESYFLILGRSEKVIKDIQIPETSELERIVTSELDMTGEEIFEVVDEQPVPIGGIQEYYKYVAKNLRYPQAAAKLGIEGRVFIEFIITKDGSVVNAKCIKGIGDLCDSEAVRVISNSPNWIPGKKNGENVNVKMVLPITFKLG